MKLTAYRLKLQDGTYLSGDSIQSTKDKYKALMTIDRAEKYIDYIDGECLVESVELNLKECKRGSLRFNFDDTYGIESQSAFIVHQTNKFTWTCKNDNGTPVLSSIQKHKNDQVGTVNFKTGEGLLK